MYIFISTCMQIHIYKCVYKYIYIYMSYTYIYTYIFAIYMYIYLFTYIVATMAGSQGHHLKASIGQP